MFPLACQAFSSLWTEVSSLVHPFIQGHRKSEQSKTFKEILHSKEILWKWAHFLAEIQTFELIVKDILGIYQYFLPHLQTKMINIVHCIIKGETHIKYEGTGYLIYSSNSEVKVFLHCRSRFSYTKLSSLMWKFLLRTIFHMSWNHLCILLSPN